MTKKELETHNRLLDLLEANTKTMERLIELTTLLNSHSPSPTSSNGIPPEVSTDKIDWVPDALSEKVIEGAHAEAEKAVTPVEKISIEYCRKALVKIASLTSDEKARDWLYEHWEVRTLPELPEITYEAFIKEARKFVIAETPK